MNFIELFDAYVEADRRVYAHKHAKVLNKQAHYIQILEKQLDQERVINDNQWYKYKAKVRKAFVLGIIIGVVISVLLVWSLV